MKKEKKQVKILCKKCNKIATNFLRKEFFKMIKGEKNDPAKYSTFIRRLSKFIEETTGNINTVIYLDTFLKKVEYLEKKNKK